MIIFLPRTQSRQETLHKEGNFTLPSAVEEEGGDGVLLTSRLD